MYSDIHLARNLDALKRIGAALPALTRPGDAIRLESHAGEVRLEVRLPDGSWALHPGPEWDAANEAVDAIMVGAGDGSRLEEALASSAQRRVLVIEPDPGVMLLLLSSRDWTGVIEAGRLALVSGPTYAGAANAAHLLRGDPPATLLLDPLDAMRLPQTALAGRLLAERLAREAATNARARRRLAGPYLLQSLANLPALARESNAAALRGRFAGVPIVLVAAGPSLDRTLPSLRNLQDRALIVAADTTLRPLLAGGVRPHLMVSIDPSELNARHLSDVADVEGIFLAAEGSLHPRAFDSFTGRTFGFRISDHEPWRALRSHGVDLGLVRAWGSVATAAFDLALQLQAGPVIFTGHDFAYSGNRPYCDNTRFHDEWRAYLAHNPGTIEHYEDQMMNGRPTVEVRDILGCPVRTGTQLIAFREWIVDQASAHPEVTFINATEGGILEAPHIRQSTLETVLAPFPARTDLRDRLRAAHRAGAGSLDRADRVLRSMLDQPDGGSWNTWVAFSGGALSRDSLASAAGDAVSRWPTPTEA